MTRTTPFGDTTALGNPTGKRRSARLWRVLGTLSLAGAIAALGGGVALAFFTATGTGTGSTAVGRLDLLSNAVKSFTCTLPAMAAGESSTGWSGTGSHSDTPCTFTVTLTTSGPVFLGISTTVGGTGLYSPGGLRFQISDTASNAYTTNGTINTNAPTDPLYVGMFSSSATHTFTVDFSLPSSVTTSVEGHATTLTLTLHAVSVGATTTTTGCTAGLQCPGIARWS